MKIDFHQIYYKEEQRPELYQFATPYFNDTLTPYFENKIISQIVMSPTCTDPECDSITECGLPKPADKIAVCSWALRRKRTSVLPPKRELTAEVLEEDFDVMSFTRNTSDHDMLGALEAWHPGSKLLLNLIFSELSVKMPRKPKFPIYQNHFCATRDVYQEYVAEFLEPAMNLMEMDEEIRSLCWANSNYTRTILNEQVDSERMMKFFGVPYVPLHSFLLERCFSLWIDDKKLNVKYL